jgi:hypothetical protein
MPRKRKSKPRSADHAALAQAIEVLIAEDPQMTQDTVADDSGLTRSTTTFAARATRLTRC